MGKSTAKLHRIVVYSLLVLSCLSTISIGRIRVPEKIKGSYKYVKKSIKNPFKQLLKKKTTDSNTDLTFDIGFAELENEQFEALKKGLESINSILKEKKKSKKNENSYGQEIQQFDNKMGYKEAQNLYKILVVLERKTVVDNKMNLKLSRCLNSAIDLVKAAYTFSLEQKIKDRGVSTINKRSQEFLFKKSAGAYLKEQCSQLQLLANGE